MSNKKGKRLKREAEAGEQSNNAMDEVLFNLPKDLFLDILARLPLKSLIGCRCVCKTWRNLLTDPNFANIHLIRSSQMNKNNSPDVILATHPFFDYERSELFYIQHFGDHVSNGEKLRFPNDQKSLALVDSINGLLCLFQIFRVNPLIYVYNPFTFEYIELPGCELPNASSINFQLVGFGFHPKTNQYKVVRFLVTWDDRDSVHGHGHLAFRIETEVYTLGLSSGSWRKIQDAPFTPYLNQNILVNGALHWFSWVSGSKCATIHSFDIGDEEFRVVPSPTQFVPNGERNLVRIDVLDGCLALVDHSSLGKIEIWVMQCYGVMESWTKRYVVSMIGIPVVKSVKLVCVLKNGEILIQRDGKKLLCYNPRSGSVRRFDVRRSQTQFAPFLHVGSLVSPCRVYGGY